MKRWREYHDPSVVHAEGAIAAGEFTLCGLALEGEQGDSPMSETRDLVRCENCEAIILHCKLMKPAELNPFSRRRMEAKRAAR